MFCIGLFFRKKIFSSTLKKILYQMLELTPVPRRLQYPLGFGMPFGHLCKYYW